MEEHVRSSLGSDESVIIDLEFAKDVVNLGLREFVAPCLECVREHLRIYLSRLFTLALISAESADDQIIGVIGACKGWQEKLHANTTADTTAASTLR